MVYVTLKGYMEFTYTYIHTYCSYTIINVAILNQNVTFIGILITIQRQDLFLYGMAQHGQGWSDKSKIAMCC